MSLNAVVRWFYSIWDELFGASKSGDIGECSPIQWRTTKGGIWYMGSPAHRAWQRAKLRNGGAWEKTFLAVSGNEGSSSAYQNYDNQGVTLGSGWGGRGQLGTVARNLGMPEFVPIPDNGNKYSNELIESMRRKDYAEKYVCFAESEQYRDRVLEAQVAAFKSGKIGYGFSESNLPLLYLLSHMAHWLPGCVEKGGWTGNDSVDVPRLLNNFGALCSKYGIKPSQRQIDHYVSTYRKMGGTYAP